LTAASQATPLCDFNERSAVPIGEDRSLAAPIVGRTGLPTMARSTEGPQMESNQKAYALPTETAPSLGIDDLLNDLVRLKDFLERRGLKTANTRIERYITYLQRTLLDGPQDASTVFKNSTDARFKSPADWQLYVMREVHELMWILKGLDACLPAGVDEKLKVIVSGRDFAALDGDSRSRDAQFELRIASYFCQTGCHVVLSGATDIVALTDREAFYVECKRIGSGAQLGKRLTEARKQLQTRMPPKLGKRMAVGGVAADVTKVAFSRNGLTFGVTNEHSRDVIQDKLIAIADDAQQFPLYRDCSSLLFYWFQIHIPALILQPPRMATRFSSYHVLREVIDRKQRRAAKVFYQLFESASKATDPREQPPEKLVRRKEYVFPVGTTFTLGDELERILARDPSPTDDEEEFIGELTVNGTSHKFTVFDLRFVSQQAFRECRDAVQIDRMQGGLRLLVEMYVQRFPYEKQD